MRTSPAPSVARAKALDYLRRSSPELQPASGSPRPISRAKRWTTSAAVVLGFSPHQDRHVPFHALKRWTTSAAVVLGFSPHQDRHAPSHALKRWTSSAAVVL